ncbi:MAG: aldo/keto reductase [Verrucomicrobiales bacterium]|nr:aldo/keto reductase [Verrucomicrobiales bacterium]
MNLTKTAFGSWSGGRFMHFGQRMEEDRWVKMARQAYDEGVRTFLTSDVYGIGQGDELLGKALEGVDRDSYCLVAMIGHDIYDGQRAGAKGYARFTNPELRGPDGYAEYLQRATTKCAGRCGTDHFDIVMLHNPDSIGYSSPEVWSAMATLREKGLAESTGIAPGPANGFAIDMAYCIEHFHEEIDSAMIILNPMEPWPGRYVLPIAQEFDVDILARVVDFGGIFHDDVKPGHFFKDGDHRTYRPEGWIEHGNEKLEKMRPIAEKYDLTMLQLACIWDLSQDPVKSVGPTFIQEAGHDARPVEDKIAEFAALPDVTLTSEEIETIREIGNNEGCMPLKGASTRYEGEPQPDHWPMRPELQPIADKWSLNPAW